MTISVLYSRYIVEIQEIWSACLIGALGVVHTPREERTNLKNTRDVNAVSPVLSTFSYLKKKTFFVLVLRRREENASQLRRKSRTISLFDIEKTIGMLHLDDWQ